MVGDSDIEDLRAAGWGEKGIYEATALVSFFNYSGRMEAASGLPMDTIQGLTMGQMPAEGPSPKATSGRPYVSVRDLE